MRAIVDASPEPDAAPDAPIDAPADASAPDAAAPPIDARARPVAAAIDAGAGGRADAAIATPDAAPPDAAVPEGGKIVVVNDTWCEVSIDKVARGRLPAQSTFDVGAGTHTVVCAQPGIAEWTKPADVPPGKTVRVEGTMLAPVAIRFEVDAQIGGTSFSRGDSTRLKPGRTNVIVGGKSVWIDIPRFACRLRQDAGRLVCDP